MGDAVNPKPPLMKLISVILFSFSLGSLFSAPDPPVIKKDLDFLEGDQLPGQRSHAWALGPTGARGWAQTGKSSAAGNTTRSREIYVTEFARNSPAAGILQRGDIIFGLNGKPFESDARLAFAKEISKVEAADGKLSLLRFRDGKRSEVTIGLTQRPNWSATAPFEC